MAATQQPQGTAGLALRENKESVNTTIFIGRGPLFKCNTRSKVKQNNTLVSCVKMQTLFGMEIIPCGLYTFR